MTRYLVTIAILLSLTAVGYFGIGSLLQTSASSLSDSVVDIAFTLDEIAKHSSINDCYLLVNNNVYDVTRYSGSHPGGAMNISNQCGQDSSSIFKQIHSNLAWDLLANYKIGTLAK
ncbi:hypothetical protein CO057_03665 [Candidatus Uhrbacteria bacterium CG_4_9_14_0_2_um_filter_41_50]|uniref:Cytochrome b5 heme-binding domain-containing protein n=1 Tax=Candidatus Uhrbacteria bacterium CG_4_9_14_0_2_um_filter_41_50 TaxID=1975031 RepID=A0A2M8ENH0_9BACT|nr:MAG: hypothetical protein COZ45_01300 [Candidatus Uhrbacteria bacterium CG_4_10_14_3_um_filter_41_21]PIZ54538.1 MAG: hypothetical protein COY24_03405 [Candidatus Uhrbacteria bacterium CG_4_10_14_0_2_um_filter_41_21]PJB84805.1 MAG: hypothetical protein CO086_01585 [Candidatus Uhrbacteria bacterium CG_4_9_14_0_8_um_filter_41_16]PJC24289.1 MAG: hypothetical protein CO057_03665 [Candidatus Uhrbacteria bacterium CG_4_9_14_0_2_um_filter_41_50]PJE74812.1 MAG: hypothetical protein COV03_03555 [Candi